MKIRMCMFLTSKEPLEILFSLILIPNSKLIFLVYFPPSSAPLHCRQSEENHRENSTRQTHSTALPHPWCPGAHTETIEKTGNSMFITSNRAIIFSLQHRFFFFFFVSLHFLSFYNSNMCSICPFSGGSKARLRAEWWGGGAGTSILPEYQLARRAVQETRAALQTIPGKHLHNLILLIRANCPSDIFDGK